MNARSLRNALPLAAFGVAAVLCACGGGGAGSAAVPAQAQATSWIAALRYEPTNVVVSLQTALPPFMYVDSGATNGVYPSPTTFAAELQAANPGLLTGDCSKITQMGTAVMEFTDSRGVQAPSYIVFFQPKTVGSCTQPINLGAEGTRSFSVTVTP